MNSSRSSLATLAEWLVTAIDSENKLDADTKFLAAEGWVLVIRVIIVYAVVLATMSTWMGDMDQVDLGKLPTCWNILLSMCSAFGILAVIPETFQIISRNGGLHSCICDLEQLKTLKFQGWIKYFGYLKLLELGDSVLAVLEKKPLTYLHIHHHLSILWAAHALVFHFPVFRLLVASNLLNNFVLYGCLALENSGWISKTILNCTTRLQALPRAIALASCLYVFRMKYNGQDCDAPTIGLIIGAVGASLYFVNFLRSFNFLQREEKQMSKRE